jgi:hypothetical protein
MEIWKQRLPGFVIPMVLVNVGVQETTGLIAVTAKNKHEQFSRCSLLVRVENVMQHFEYTKSKGARILQTPQEYPYGEKQYTAEDIEGHVWTFSESVQDLLPEDWGGVSKKLE